MKKLLLASAVAAALASPAAVMAQAAPASPHTVTGNLSFVSDYRFRGITQTYDKPGIQGGIDYSHSSGFYLGTWGASLSGLQFANTSGLEWDFYGGYKFSAGPIGFDVGLLYYWYPGAYIFSATGEKTKYNNTEVYVGASWEWLSLKYSHGTSNFFGLNATTGGACPVDSSGTATAGACLPTTGSRGSGYLDLTATFPLAPGLNLVAHYGKQKVKNYSDLSYSDYKLGVTYDALGFTWGVAAIGTNAKSDYYRVAQGDGTLKDVTDDTIVLTVAKTF